MTTRPPLIPVEQVDLVELIVTALVDDDLRCSEFRMEPASDEWFESNARAVLKALEPHLEASRPQAREAAEATADAALLGADMVLESRAQAVTAYLANSWWSPTRAHIEGCRNAMKEAREYIANARRAIRTLRGES